MMDTAHHQQPQACSRPSRRRARQPVKRRRTVRFDLSDEEFRELSAAADRAGLARGACGRLPRPTPAGNRLRAAARILSAVAIVTSDPLIAQLRLILQLAVLAEAVTDLRTAQRHAAQAGAARAAAERLYAARRSYTSPPGGRATARARGNQARP